MPNALDMYREALVVEHQTIWPSDFDDWTPEERARIETVLHATPADAADLDYVRQHTGFARVITVTNDDLSRLAGTGVVPAQAGGN